MMDRREFGKMSLAGIAIASLSSFMTACAINAKALLNTVIAAVQAVLKVAAPTEPWVAQLSAALNALVTAEEASWTAGGAVTIVIDALNTIANVCAVIPLTAVYSPLIDVLVAGIDAVLAVLVPPAGAKLKVMAIANPHRGRVVINTPRRFAGVQLQTEQGAFKGQWNDLATQIGLPQAKI
jgi:hypothetical protein